MKRQIPGLSKAALPMTEVPDGLYPVTNRPHSLPWSSVMVERRYSDTIEQIESAQFLPHPGIRFPEYRRKVHDSMAVALGASDEEQCENKCG